MVGQASHKVYIHYDTSKWQLYAAGPQGTACQTTPEAVKVQKKLN